VNHTPDSALARDHIFSCATTKAAVVIRASAISRALVGIKEWTKIAEARRCERSEAIPNCGTKDAGVGTYG
jgi:hypothetical protein